MSIGSIDGETVTTETDRARRRLRSGLFCAVAHACCKASNQGRVLVEIKLSINGKLVGGYSRQLKAYKTAEETVKGYYGVLGVDSLEKSRKSLLAPETRPPRSARRIGFHIGY